jgi:predicted amidohydrolase YtcJ
MPASPARGIAWALAHPTPAERLDRNDAVRLYTEEAATPGRPSRGRIAPGEIADLAVLADLPERLPGAGEADLTLIDGEIVHRRKLEAGSHPW